MGISASREDSLEIISLKPLKKVLGINPMSISAPSSDSLEIIALQTV